MAPIEAGLHSICACRQSAAANGLEINIMTSGRQHMDGIRRLETDSNSEWAGSQPLDTDGDRKSAGNRILDTDSDSKNGLGVTFLAR